MTGTLILAFVAFLLWSCVFFIDKKKGIGWISPTCLFSLGIILFYIMPSIYWIVRPWTSELPPYFDGLWLVMLSSIILGFPFLFHSMLRKSYKYSIKDFDFVLISRTFSNKICIFFVLLAFLSVFFEIELLNLGNQSRLGTKQISLFGSPDLGYLFINNILSIWPIFYIFLILFGGKKYKTLGLFLWMTDGVICIVTLQRTQILNFLLYTFVILGLLGHKFSIKKIIFSSLVVIFVIVVVGNTPKFVRNRVETQGLESINTFQTIDVLYASASEQNYDLIDYVDLTMERLYEARSASAVMANVPDKINYQYGSTLLHVFYAIIPRYIWTEKPSLREIHKYTLIVMPDDIGLNPLGTLGEFYINYGLLFVFLGGLMSLYCCSFLESRFVYYFIKKRQRKLMALIIIYPISSIWIIGSSYNFTQRLSEGLRLVILFYILYFIFSIFKR